jgi:protocatechuate 3,4-dioxygenase beta subunit
MTRTRAGEDDVPDALNASCYAQRASAGLVLSTRCAPIAGAVVNLWHADAEGRYDDQGFRLRGHQYTDTAGRYRFETIVPGNYGPRTRHYPTMSRWEHPASRC